MDLLAFPRRPHRAGRHAVSAVAGRLVKFFDGAGRLIESLISVDAAGNLTTPGAISAGADADVTHILGRGRIASPSSDEVAFGHLDHASSPAIKQGASGDTLISAPAGQAVSVAPGGGSRVLRAEGGGVLLDDTGSGSRDPALLLDLVSTSQAAAFPRMTTLQRDAIASPPVGAAIVNTTTGRYEAYLGGAWRALLIATDLATLAPFTLGALAGSAKITTASLATGVAEAGDTAGFVKRGAIFWLKITASTAITVAPAATVYRRAAKGVVDALSVSLSPIDGGTVMYATAVLPYEDLDGAGALHWKITNNDAVTAAFDLEVRAASDTTA